LQRNIALAGGSWLYLYAV